MEDIVNNVTAENAQTNMRTKLHVVTEMQKTPVARIRNRSHSTSCKKNFQQQLLDSKFLQTSATAIKKKPSENKRDNRTVRKTLKNDKIDSIENKP